MCEVCTTPALLLGLAMHVDTTPRDMAAGMGQAFSTLMALIQGNRLTIAGPPRAVYSSLCDPMTTPEQELLTYIYLPLR